MLALMELTVEIEVHHSSFYKMLLSAFQVKKSYARRGDALRYSKQIFLRMTVMRKTYATSDSYPQSNCLFSPVLSSHTNL